MVLLAYLLATVSILTGTAAVYMALLEQFPVRWLYYHYFVRKPIVWTILVVLVTMILHSIHNDGRVDPTLIAPVILGLLGVLLTYRMHQEAAFRAEDYRRMTTVHNSLPLSGNMEIAVIEYNGVTKGYPLQYVIHHHIVNDWFNDKLVSLTYCAMCRSIIPFDVTDLGPMFVASFKGANMIVADRKTKTFFQQATFESIIGPLHPATLKMIPFQILGWELVKKIQPSVPVADVTEDDLRAFELPIPGIWKRIVATESTPGLSSKRRDKTFPARTRVVGIIEPGIVPQPVYLKTEVVAKQLVHNHEHNFILVGGMNTVNGFKVHPHQKIVLNGDLLQDHTTHGCWDLRGKTRQQGVADLEPLAISDEYWFSWKEYHPDSTVIRQELYDRHTVAGDGR